MKRLITLFFQGLIYTAPFAVTAYVLYKVFVFLDDILKPLFIDVLGFHIPGVGLIIVFLFIAFMGWLGQTIIAKPVRKLFDRMMQKTPLIKLIYSSIKDLLTAFVGKEKKFNQPVLVKVNHISNLEKLGFLTQDDLSLLNIENGMVAVYFPHSYNFSGELFLVPAKDVKKIDVAPAEVMKFIVSGGASNVSIKSNQ